MDGPKPYKFIGFGDMDGPKPYKFTGFGPTCKAGRSIGPRRQRRPRLGSRACPGPWECPGLRCDRVRGIPEARVYPKPYEFIGFGAMEVTKPYKFIGFGAMDVTKPYKFIGSETCRVGDLCLAVHWQF